MITWFRFLIGACVGVGALAFPVASVAVYLLTGKIAMPDVAGGGLLTPDEVAAQLQDLTKRTLEQPHG